MKNKEISEMFAEIGEMIGLEETPTSRFEARAFQNASLMLDTMQEDIEEIYRKGGRKALMELPSIGKGLADEIIEFIETGRIGKYEKLKGKYPIDFKELSKVEGLGAKKIVVLYRNLGIKDVDGLKRAVSEQKIRGVPGFGERSEAMIGRGIELLESGRGRILLGEALPVAESIVAKLLESGLVERAMIAGSARRMRETVGDIDILAISGKGRAVMDLFAGMEGVKSVISKGEARTTVWLEIGTSCDLRVIDADSRNFGAALQYFTGSKEHSVSLRKIAIGKGYKLNEYGLFDRKDKLIRCGDEEELYGKMGMQYIPPEMREDRGEIKLAQQHRIPKLVEMKEIKGDLHSHTKETDGSNTAGEMAYAAYAEGLEYIAATNHTKSLRIARGMDERGFGKFFREIDRLNEIEGKKAIVLKGAEVDILKDGRLDLPTKLLGSMDCVVAAVHSSFNMDGKSMTERVVKALDSGVVDILAHPTGRLINGRGAYEIDLDRVAEAAERNHVALEVNSYPNRLDLNDSAIMRLSSYKILFSIDSDSHSTQHFKFLRYGVGTARRGWLTKRQVLNTLPIEKLLKRLRG